MVKRKNKNSKLMRNLLWALGVLIVALIVVLIIILATGGKDEEQQKVEQLYETAEYVTGVSISGVDISGLMFDEANTKSELLSIAGSATDNVSFTFNVDGVQFSFTAEELGVTSNFAQVLEDAMLYGNSGSGAQIREERGEARENGMDFAIGLHAEETVVYEKLQQIKPMMDILPQDASLDIVDAVLGEARFIYTDEVKGVDVDIAQLAKLIGIGAASGDFSAIEAPVIITNPKIDVVTLKENTKLIASFSSFFDSPTLSKEGRVNNIQILGDFVNGVVIMPGETWSINEEAGPRIPSTATTIGWSEAPGISNGRYEEQLGGGVCQVSSSVYNAAILAELEIVSRNQHSWPSGYIVEGMDATISTGGPDLVLGNPYDMPIYLAVFVEEEEFKVTVEVYGPPLTHGYTVRFVSNLVQTIQAGDPIYHYDSLVDPEGNEIPEGATVTWIKGKNGQVWEVTKQYVDEDGNVIMSEKFSSNRYKAFTYEYYVNGPDPAIAGPTPLPSPSPTP
ncbi:MAG: hypothetical protein HN948_08950 [Clostridia bacterium]|nr:hypothetical protein [Clostridia bacterium]MBT7123118.1 hypothetical protein [Clostridia bacterium]